MRARPVIPAAGYGNFRERIHASIAWYSEPGIDLQAILRCI
jgi:hypothetical protein